MEIIDVVAAVIKRNNKYLVTQRNKNKYMSLKWEFPGGKVEKGETLKEALLREIKEELSVEIDINMKITKEKYKDEKINIILHYYFCSLKSGIIKLNEHEDLAWIEKKDFGNYIFVEGDKKILNLL
jgi:8-oxo-dGTP diphosphatase